MKQFLQATLIIALALWSQMTSRITLKTGLGYLLVENTITFILIWVALLVIGTPIYLINQIMQKIIKRNNEKEMNKWI